MKSLDYTFSDENTAISTPKTKFERKNLEAHAYRQRILAGRGGGSSSAGQLSVDDLELPRHPSPAHEKSPGFRREKHMDRQRKRQKEKKEKEATPSEGRNASFAQCTFNMANILMVSLLCAFQRRRRVTG